jgi:uncharacterized protein with HEPN domain
MRPEDTTLALLWDMRSCAQTVSRLVVGSSAEAYQADEVLRLAVECALDVIGEAASHVPPEFRSARPEIEWRRIVGLRHILVHAYTIVDHEILWEIATGAVPELIRRLDPLIPPAAPEPG